MNNEYEVTIKGGSEDALSSAIIYVNMTGGWYEIESEDVDGDGNIVVVLKTNMDISRILDETDDVISYKETGVARITWVDVVGKLRRMGDNSSADVYGVHVKVGEGKRYVVVRDNNGYSVQLNSVESAASVILDILAEKNPCCIVLTAEIYATVRTSKTGESKDAAIEKLLAAEQEISPKFDIETRTWSLPNVTITDAGISDEPWEYSVAWVEVRKDV